LKQVLNQISVLLATAPTQMPILTRAPGGFVHPAWILCQNVNTALDGMLDEFLRGSEQPEASTLPSQKPSKVPKVEGVWIITRKGIQKTPASPWQEDTKSTTKNDEDHGLILGWQVAGI
jgi:hypothetical protein